jgi:hypothetical protein
MLLPSLPLKFRKRPARPTPRKATTTGVLVVSVVSLPGSGGYVWTFDTPIVSTEMQPFGYIVNGSEPGEAGEHEGNSISLYYGFDDAGVPWQIVGTPTGIVFEGGKTIEPGQSGITTG